MYHAHARTRACARAHAHAHATRDGTRMSPQRPEGEDRLQAITRASIDPLPPRPALPTKDGLHSHLPASTWGESLGLTAGQAAVGKHNGQVSTRRASS